MIRSFIAMALLAAALLSACGGGGAGSSSPTPVPTTTISGVVFDAPMANATVQAWTFVNGVPMTKVGEGITAANGSYSFSIQSENAPLILIASGGYYVEEASGQTVNLAAGQKLSAVMNHATGQNDTVHITPFTHLAAGLASWKIKGAVPTNTAIDAANTSISNILGFAVSGTKPLSIADAANASAFASPGLQYGFLSAAISGWTAYASIRAGTPTHSTHNSIAFAQLIYADVSADGLLDGSGRDDLGNISQLSLGVLPLNQTVYRHALAAHVVQAANSTFNRSALTEAQVASFAANYAGNGDTIWAAVTPFSFNTRGRAVGSFTSPSGGGWIARTTNITGTVVDHVAIDTTALRVDTTIIGNAPNPAVPVFTINASGTGYTDGTHTLSFLILNSIGINSAASINVGVDNTPPTSTGNYYYTGEYPTYRVNRGTASDALSGPVSVTVLASGQTAPVAANGYWELVYPVPAGTPNNIIWPTIRIKDVAGNCSDYYYNQAGSGEWLLRASGTCL